jgi:hypothetical protein
MAGDSQECRAHGLHCAYLADKAESPELRREFLILATKWLNLANYLEGLKQTSAGAGPTAPELEDFKQAVPEPEKPA